MSRLVFNHATSQIPGPATVLSGLVLLVILGLLFGLYHNLDQTNVLLRRQFEASQASILPEAKNQSKRKLVISPTTTAEILEAQAHINTPWMPLLNALEKAQQPNVYWMHLLPDAKRKHIRMTVLAPKRQNGWVLMEHLKQQSGLSDVKLNASESTDVNGLRMTTLQLEAGWKF